MQDLKPTSFGKILVLLKAQPSPGQIKSLLHANRLAVNHLGQGTASSSNEKGSLLRRIRLDRGIDPALLATEACISLAQLYDIETGEEGLFYSPLLREQTARRVSHLLQVDWNNLSSQHLTIQSFSNVLHLPRVVSPIKPSVPVNTAAMFQKQDTFDEDKASIGLSKSSAQSPLSEIDSGQNEQSDSSALTPRRSKNIQWLALILIAYSTAVFVTLGSDALSTTQSALDAAMLKWSKWFVL
jgi:transcriptional regulator with XRE-family HTH domain